MFGKIFTVIAPVFTVVGLGYCWALFDQRFDSETLTNLVLKLATPCLIFSSLTSIGISLATVGQMALAATISMSLAALFGWFCLKHLNLSQRTYLPSLMHANTGNIGLPLVLMAFGDEGLALGVSFFVVNSISQYSIGHAISAGSFSIWHLLKQPLNIAIVSSLLVLAFNIHVPEWIANTTDLIGGLVIPALLMVLGHSLAQLKISDFRLSLQLAVVRMVIGICLGFLLVVGFKLDGARAGVVFLMSTMPVAVFNFVFAKHFDRSPEKVAGVVVFSTLLVFALLPGFVWVALRLAEQ